MRAFFMLAIIALCLFNFILQLHSRIWPFCQELGLIFLSLQWLMLICLAVWYAMLVFLTFSLRDSPMVGLIVIAVIEYFISYATLSGANAMTLLAGVTVGRGAWVLLKSGKRKAEMSRKSEGGNNISEIANRKSQIANFLIGLVVLLAFSSWWHLNATGTYHGPRWMGLWDNPNVYGMLMGAGVVLTIGLLARSQKLLKAFLFVTAGMMLAGLMMSYSRGAWLGTIIGLLYLAWCYGKLKWKYVVTGVGLLALGAGLFWGRTPDSAPWYLKRADLSRPSAQHRVAAWKAGFKMMQDHPFGVGWNKAVGIYSREYSAPENGAAALTMDSYLMLGTELGIPALVCFIAYVWLCLKSPKSQSAREDTRSTSLDATQVACRAGAVTLLVAFWFDGGLFKLPTAAMFWVLLELGSEKAEARKPKTAMSVTPSSETSAS
jgi:hypothetical protein